MFRIFKFKRNVFGIKKKKLCFAKHCVLKIVIQELQSKQVTNTISKINYFFVIWSQSTTSNGNFGYEFKEVLL